jgi:hypothetical protein
MKKVREWIHWRRRRLRFWVNRLRLGWEVHRRGWLVRVTVPARHRRAVRALKFLVAMVGLAVTWLVLPLPWPFVIALLLYVIGEVLERTIFSYAALFVHAMPTFEVDPDNWVGVGFGFARPPGVADGSRDIPMVGMMVTEVEYARRLQGLFLTWTGGQRDDVAGDLRVSIIVMSPTEYVFMAYPNPDRPAARQTFDEARREIRRSSLEDILHEHHGMVVLGKRCMIGPGSYFPQFRRRWRPGVPTLFGFGFYLPPFGEARWADDPPPIVAHGFSIRDRRDLTRRDWEHGVVGAFEVDGTWQGPPEQEPRA